ncbi:MAG: NAD(P)-binding protein [Phycisphaeraceae bacterium]
MNQPTTPSPQRDPLETIDGQAGGSDRRRAIVAGFGPVGRMTAEQLERAGLQVTIVETNLATIERQLHLDRRVLFGDVTDPDILRRAGIDGADALILTIPNEAAAVAACEVARRLNPAIFIAARTSFLSQGLLATQAGADHVVVEEVVTAEAMQRAVVDRLLK